MKKLLIFLLLTACGEAKIPHDYTFEGRQVTNLITQVTLYEYDSYSELKKQYLVVRKRQAPESLIAFTVVTGNTCCVYILKPEVDFQPSYLGHEIAHCFYGHWHPKQDKSR